MFRQKPQLNNLVQNLFDRYGNPVYRDTDNIVRAPDTTPQLKFNKNGDRTGQPSRYYAFSANEIIDFGAPAILNQTDFTCRIIFSFDVANADRVFTVSWSSVGGNRGWTVRFRFDEIRLELGYGTVSVEEVIFDQLTLVTGVVHELVIEKTGQTCIATLDGVPQTKTAVNTLIMGTGNATLGGRISAEFDGEIYFWEVETASGKLTVDADEGAGLVAYDSSGNGNHGTISLGGTAESTFHASATDLEIPSKQNELGYNQVGRFNGDADSYYEIPYNSNLSLNNFECECVFMTFVNQQYHTIHDIDDNNSISATLRLFNRKPRCHIDGTDYIATSITNTAEANVVSIITQKKYGTTLILGLDGEEQTFTGVSATITYDNSQPMLIGRLAGFGSQNLNGIIISFKFWELDSSGNRVKQLIDADFVNGTSELVKNIANAAPDNTDLYWQNTGSTPVLYTPQNLQNPTQDVLGNDLPETHIGRVQYQGEVESSVMSFDGTLNGSWSNESWWKIDNFEIDCLVYWEINGNIFNTIVSLGGETGTAGIKLRVTPSTGVLGLIWANTTTYTTAIPSGEWTRITVKRYASTSDLYINGEYKESLARAGTNTFGTQAFIGYRSASTANETYIHPISYFNFYELDSSGNRTKHLIHLTGADKAGDIWHNNAPDAPADSHAIINLNGSADGDQWALSKYGVPEIISNGGRLVGGFDGNLYLTSQIVSPSEIDELEFLFYTPRTWVGEDSNREGLFAFDTTEVTSMAVLGGISGVLTNETFSYLQGNTYRTGMAVQIDAGFHKIKMVYDDNLNAGRYRLYLDDVEQSLIGNTTAVNIHYSLNKPCIGCSKLSGSLGSYLDGFIYKVIASGSGWGVEWDFSNLENGVVPNTADNAPANSDAILNLNGSYSGREQVWIPAATNLVDVYGQPLSVKPQGRALNGGGRVNLNPVGAPELNAAGTAKDTYITS